jgi:hypothetical protein
MNLAEHFSVISHVYNILGISDTSAQNPKTAGDP